MLFEYNFNHDESCDCNSPTRENINPKKRGLNCEHEFIQYFISLHEAKDFLINEVDLQ
jgi:hypothetical protein